MLEAAADIEESVQILLMTRPGERLMHPEYGCNLHDHIFDTMDGDTEAAIIATIRDAILYFEPRVTLHKVSLDLDQWIEGRLVIALDYSIDQINTRSNVVYPFYLVEGTLIAQAPAKDLTEVPNLKAVAHA